MIKVRKAYILVLATIMAQALVTTSLAAFGFSFPFGTIVAGPGISSVGPTTFNTFFHDATMTNVGAASDAAANAIAGIPFTSTGVPFFGPGCIPGVPFGFSPFGIGSEIGESNIANVGANANWAEDNTFATSFSTAGGVTAGFPGLVGGSFAGQFPLFGLNFF